MSTGRFVNSMDPRSGLEVIRDWNGVAQVVLRSPKGASARVSLHGGQVVSWRNDRGEELLFTAARTYKHLSGRFYPHQAFKWLWRSSCQNKHKVFFWLLLKDRISTRELLKRKNMILQDYNCILCSSSTEESLTHLFLHCPFAVQCWAWLNVQVDQSLDPFQTLQSFKDQLPVPFFMEIIIIMCWTIWKVRNDMIFRQVSPRMQNAKEDFRKEFELLLLRVKKSYSPQINIWTANLA